MEQTPEPGTPTSAAASPVPDLSDATIVCAQCGETVPDLAFCIRCGDPLDDEHRHGRSGRVRESYAAAPGERATSVRIISTLFPALPRESLRTFQVALLAGIILVVALGVLGFYPVAIVAAAVLVPLLTVIYLYDVDTYEDEPIRVVALTFIWGLVAGTVFTLVMERLLPTNAVAALGSAVAAGGGGGELPLARGIVVPVLSLLLMIAGPAVLLPYKRFNDVLDGATFGVASAVAFVGAQTLIKAIDLFQGGLHPVGAMLPWVLRLLTISVAMPLIAAGAVGGLGGVLWLRYRAPVRDRSALGPLGQPIVAGVLAAALLVVAALAQESLAQIPALLVLALLAVGALIWLRRVIHLGLLQESREIPVGEPIVCPDCGQLTPMHTFCGRCGVSLRALPKARNTAPAPAVASGPGGLLAPHEVVTPLATSGDGSGAVAAAAAASGRVSAPAHHGWLGSRGIIVAFTLVLLTAVAAAGAYAWVVTQGQDKPECPDRNLPCVKTDQGLPSAASARLGILASTAGASIPKGPPFADLTTYTDSTLGFSFQYGDPWSVSQHDAGYVLLTAGNGSVALILEGTPNAQMDVQQLFDARHGLLDKSLFALATDDDAAHALLGNPILGHKTGIAGLFGGSLDSAQGPSAAVSAAEVAASDGTITMVATLLTSTDVRAGALQAADAVIDSFTWPSEPMPQ